MHVVEKLKVPLNRQIEEGVFNVKEDDYNPGEIGLRSSYNDADVI